VEELAKQNMEISEVEVPPAERKSVVVNRKAMMMRQSGPDGPVVNQFESASEAGKILGIDKSTVSKWCRSNAREQGYYWSYLEIPADAQENFKIEAVPIEAIPNDITGAKRKTGKTVLMRESGSDGPVTKQFDSAKKAGSVLGLDNSAVGRWCREKAFEKGFYWSYDEPEQEEGLKSNDEKDDDSDQMQEKMRTVRVRKVVLIRERSPDGPLVGRFESATKAAKKLGFSRTALCRWCREKAFEKNYYWSYDVTEPEEVELDYEKDVGVHPGNITRPTSGQVIVLMRTGGPDGPVVKRFEVHLVSASLR
jgi:uncharacterized metal-binding protein